MNQSEAKNKLVQDWLRDITKDNRHLSALTGTNFIILLVALFTKWFQAWELVIIYLLYPIGYFWFFGMVLKYKVAFSYDNNSFKLDALYDKLTSENVRYEKVIYVSRFGRSEKYWLALEIWFDRQPFAFMEQLKTIDERTEQKYFGKGIRASYWSRTPGQIDVIADFIDEYNRQKDSTPANDQKH